MTVNLRATDIFGTLAAYLAAIQHNWVHITRNLSTSVKYQFDGTNASVRSIREYTCSHLQYRATTLSQADAEVSETVYSMAQFESAKRTSGGVTAVDSLHHKDFT